MHALTLMARPLDKEVPLFYYDFMAKDSVSQFISITFLFLFLSFLLAVIVDGVFLFLQCCVFLLIG